MLIRSFSTPPSPTRDRKNQRARVNLLDAPQNEIERLGNVLGEERLNLRS